MLTKGGVFAPDLPGPLPESFTLEFDLLAGSKHQGRNIAVAIVALDDPKNPAGWQLSGNRFRLDLDANYGGTGGSWIEPRHDGAVVGPANATTSQFHFEKKNPVRVSIWRQKQRVRVYLNEEKAWDVPKALVEGAKYNAIVFYQHDVAPEYQYYLGPLRLAVGAPDTRNKLMTAGKWVTHGIRFDSGSAVIRGESYGTLKEIASVLKENAAIKVKIVGHTDSDGEEAANLDLSKKRAEAVKAALASEFGIDAARMEADGKGESQPADKNDTAAGKANNRRVEFLKV
jgi:outer membrane protein OmpA-like peptidoglycan-associated protein